MDRPKDDPEEASLSRSRMEHRVGGRDLSAGKRHVARSARGRLLERGRGDAATRRGGGLEPIPGAAAVIPERGVTPLGAEAGTQQRHEKRGPEEQDRRAAKGRCHVRQILHASMPPPSKSNRTAGLPNKSQRCPEPRYSLSGEMLHPRPHERWRMTRTRCAKALSQRQDTRQSPPADVSCPPPLSIEDTHRSGPRGGSRRERDPIGDKLVLYTDGHGGPLRAGLLRPPAGASVTIRGLELDAIRPVPVVPNDHPQRCVRAGGTSAPSP